MNPAILMHSLLRQIVLWFDVPLNESLWSDDGAASRTGKLFDSLNAHNKNAIDQRIFPILFMLDKFSYDNFYNFLFQALFYFLFFANEIKTSL